MHDNSAETELTIQHRDLRLTVAPYGASLRGLCRERPNGQLEPIITGYTGAQGKVGGQGDVLIPFPSRIRGGEYAFDQQTYQLPCNDKDGPNAIHGFLRLVPWTIVEQSPCHVTFGVSVQPHDYPGYPFALHITVTYRLDDQGLTCQVTLTNTGERAAPVGAGFHPYVTTGSAWIDADHLQVPMAEILEMENLIPTGRILTVDNTVYDFRQPRVIGTTQLNTCYLNPLRDPDGMVRLRLSSTETGQVVTVWMDSTFNYVVLFSGDGLPESHRRRALAIEPMTCGTDAFNHPDWGLTVLAPGEQMSGSWGVTAERIKPSGSA